MEDNMKIINLICGILLLFITGCKPTIKPIPLSEQNPQILNKKVVKNISAEYLLYLPEKYYEKKQWPLIFFLHGAAERGDDINKLKDKGLPQILKGKKDFPFIVVSPQCPGDAWWTHDSQLEVLSTVLDDIVKRYKVDKDRIYLTGLSMGGHGTWGLADKHPDRFAAIAPVCGNGNPDNAYKIKHIPVWVFHGARDPVVSIKGAEKMVKALQECGGDVKFTVYPKAGHDSWTATYNNPELYKWFLKYSRKKAINSAALKEIVEFSKSDLMAKIKPMIYISGNAVETKIVIQLKNLTSVPMHISGKFLEQDSIYIAPIKIDELISPKSNKDINVTLKGKRLSNQGFLDYLLFQYTAEFELLGEGNAKMYRDCIFSWKRDCSKRQNKVVVDGKLNEWESLPFKVTKSGVNPKDCSFIFATAYDNDFLYLAVRTIDNKLLLDPGKEIWEQDGIEIRLDARPDPERSNSDGEGQGRDFLAILLSPERKAEKRARRYYKLPEGTKTACVVTDTGHITEVAIPVSYLNKMQGEPWKEFRLNIAVDDYDSGKDGKQLWWRPHWRSKDNFVGSGTFRRK
jgi:esterase/lipase